MLAAEEEFTTLVSTQKLRENLYMRRICLHIVVCALLVAWWYGCYWYLHPSECPRPRGVCPEHLFEEDGLCCRFYYTGMNERCADQPPSTNQWFFSEYSTWELALQWAIYQFVLLEPTAIAMYALNIHNFPLSWGILALYLSLFVTLWQHVMRCRSYFVFLVWMKRC